MLRMTLALLLVTFTASAQDSALVALAKRTNRKPAQAPVITNDTVGGSKGRVSFGSSEQAAPASGANASTPRAKKTATPAATPSAKTPPPAATDAAKEPEKADAPVKSTTVRSIEPQSTARTIAPPTSARTIEATSGARLIPAQAGTVRTTQPQSTARSIQPQSTARSTQPPSANQPPV
jgi:hypothetical protein